MSRAAKVTLLGSIALSAFTVWGVHAIQQRESDTMYAGVIRDEQRQAAKKAQREREFEFEEQLKRRAYLEKIQPVSNPTSPPPPTNMSPTGAPTGGDGDGSEMRFDGCKTC